MKTILPQKYEFSSEDINFVLSNFKELLENRSYLTMSSYCEEFEKSFCQYLGCRFAISVSSGTAALEIILRYLRVNGYEVIVPTNTAPPTVFAVMAAGGIPVFADCQQDMTIDPDDVKSRITPRTRAIITVHVGGMVSPSTYELVDLCNQKGIPLIEDAAHAHGCMLGDQKAGTFGIAAAFSFFSTKVMTTGEGGMIVTSDENLHQKASILRNHSKVPGKGNYHEEFGYNWRMTEIQALLGLTQLKRLDEFILRRNQIASIYTNILASCSELKPLIVPENVKHNYYKCIFFLAETINRQKFQNLLKERFNIILSGYVWELPCHKQPVFKVYASGELLLAEQLCNHHICPPIYYSLTDSEVEYVSNSILESISILQHDN
ncbi:MAG: DegT/DnrJ/EryC1/StrS family aminotransferase [Cyanobacteria bacterium CRU_2_1]|nr:DegT/DnrJ/EryC1/StrS family aminotransferase [Cyanobacteria bacterium CRU_2_1]